MRTRQGLRLTALLLALTLLAGLTLPAMAAETATVIRLTKTTGTVEISKSSGKSLSLLQNMRLYNGHHVGTAEESYAWINLDDSKLLKEDAESEVEVRKNGKKLEVQLCSGNIFFDVAEPLQDDESLNIRTSTTVVGIRGTSGWIEVVDGRTTRVSVLEGVVECSVADPVTGQRKTAEVRGGETALCVVSPQGAAEETRDIIRNQFAVDDVPGFVLTDLVRDVPLCDKIEEESGLDILEELAAVAGGDPSGKTADGDSATGEVLAEADRREKEDEDALHKRLEAIRKEQEKQEGESAVSADKFLAKPADQPSGQPSVSLADREDDDDSSGGSGSTETPGPGVGSVTVTFDANGGSASTGSAYTGADGTLASLPSASYGGLTFDGWYTALTGGTRVDETTAFSADATVYAHWSGWSLDGGTLTIAGTGPMGDYPIISDPDVGVWNDAPWGGVDNESYLNIQTVVIKEGVTTIGEGAFAFCENLTSVTIPEGVTSIGEMAFSSCRSLASVTIPEGVTNIGNAFGFCENLTSIAIPSSVTSLATDAFTYSENLSSITVDEANPTYCSVNGVVLDRNQTAVLLCPEGYAGSTYEIPASVTRIGEDAFKSCDNLTSMNIPEGITSIEERAFSWCTGLTSVTIPSSVASIGRNAFEGCINLTSAVIPDGVTSIEAGLFHQCRNMTSVSIPDSVTSIGAGAFRACSSLTSISIPAGVTSIGGSAFSGCSGLTSITIPEGITSIESDTFSSCSGLTSFVIPSGVTSIGMSAFQYCSNLTSIVIPDGVTILNAYTFQNSGLQSITIPASVTRIQSALEHCNSLSTINFTGTLAQWNVIDKTDSYISSGVSVVCTDGTTSTT